MSAASHASLLQQVPIALSHLAVCHYHLRAVRVTGIPANGTGDRAAAAAARTTDVTLLVPGDARRSVPAHPVPTPLCDAAWLTAHTRSLAVLPAPRPSAALALAPYQCVTSLHHATPLDVPSPRPDGAVEAVWRLIRLCS